MASPVESLDLHDPSAQKVRKSSDPQILTFSGQFVLGSLIGLILFAFPTEALSQFSQSECTACCDGQDFNCTTANQHCCSLVWLEMCDYERLLEADPYVRCYYRRDYPEWYVTCSYFADKYTCLFTETTCPNWVCPNCVNKCWTAACIDYVYATGPWECEWCWKLTDTDGDPLVVSYKSCCCDTGPPTPVYGPDEDTPPEEI